MNPLLQTDGLPDYSRIQPADVVPGLTAELAACRAGLARLLAQPQPTFENLIEPFEAMHHRLSRVFAPVSHLNAVANNDELRGAYNACLPLLAEYHAEVGQNQALYHAYEQIQARQGATLDAPRQEVIRYALREFRLAGVHEVGPSGDVDRGVRALLAGLILIETPRLIFPFARNVIADATREGGYPALLLGPVDFAELHRRKAEAFQAQQLAEAQGNA